MNFEEITSQINDAITLKQLTPTSWQITSGASFLNGDHINVVLENRNDAWILTDGKETLKYMNELYELKSNDVKMCITNILKIYGFSISSGNLVALINSPTALVNKYFDYIMCVGQLANMFAFFDKP